MCTVTVIPVMGATGLGVRLVSNRDESRGRVRTQLPRVFDVVDGGHAIWPTDPQGGGTWIAASEQGVVMSLLNANLLSPEPLPSDIVSRGRIITSILESQAANSARAAIAALRTLDLSKFAPFHLVVADRETICDAYWDRSRINLNERALGETVCFSSSGLGDLFILPRKTLWERWCLEHGVSPESQDAFHNHVWPELEPISVMMSRKNARTVSTTIAELPPVGEEVAAILDHHDWDESGGDRRRERVVIHAVDSVGAGR